MTLADLIPLLPYVLSFLSQGKNKGGINLKSIDLTQMMYAFMYALSQGQGGQQMPFNPMMPYSPYMPFGDPKAMIQMQIDMQKQRLEYMEAIVAQTKPIEAMIEPTREMIKKLEELLKNYNSGSPKRKRINHKSTMPYTEVADAASGG